MNKSKGFTIIELVVVITIIAVLSAIVLFSVTEYVDKGKDSNISANLAVLVPAGENYYTANNNSYDSFCNPDEDSVLKNIIPQMPINPAGSCYDASANPAAICCTVATDGNSWAACTSEFSDNTKAYCADSRGMREDIDNSLCISGLTVCP